MRAVAPWCWQPRPLVEARAIGPEHHVWSLEAGVVTDETLGARYVLPDELPCPLPGPWRLGFSPNGGLYALAGGRFYVASGGAAAGARRFAVTPMCTTLEGVPFAARTTRGHAFVANTRRSAGPAMLLSNDPSGASGWFATYALDPTLQSVVVDGAQSVLSLTGAGRLVVVDQVQTVAGELLAAHEERFEGLDRGAERIAAWRRVDAGHLTIVTATSLQGPWERISAAIDSPAPVRRLYAVDLARFVALTDEAVAVSTDHGAHFVTVLARPALRTPPERVARGTTGFDAEGAWVIAFPDGEARARCDGALAATPPPR